jgi:proline iminopeptidase
MKTTFFFPAALLLLTLLAPGCSKEYTLNEPGALVPMTVDQDLTLPSIQVNGTLLHAEAFGNPTDPMVVFLHGGPGADYRGGLNAAGLAYEGFYVVFYDQRGSGLSKRHDKDSYSIDIMFDDLTGVIEHYRTSPQQKVFLFGHSWGAMLACGYINEYPDAVDGVIFAEPGGFTWDLTAEYGDRSRRLSIFDEVTNDALYPDQFLTGKRENDHAVLDYKIALLMPYTYAPGNDEGIEGPSPFWRNGAAVIKKLYEIGEEEGFDFTTHLDQFTKPTLFLYSENNRAYGKTFAEREAAFLPQVTLAQVDGTGHDMIHFGWDNVHALVLPYLQSLR